MKTSMHTTLVKLLFCVTVLFARVACATTDWSSQDYDLYAGDFNGDGKTDILYIAKDPSKTSGIALSDGSGPNIPWQSWQSNYLGIAWYGNNYNIIVADFNGDGKADIFLQAVKPGDSYLILTGTDGHITAVSQTVSNSAMGLTWSSDQHRIIAGDFNGDHKADLFLQSTSAAGVNAIVTADQNGQFTASAPTQTWGNSQFGFKWSTLNSIVYAADFNGDGIADLLVQAKPTFVTVNYDVPFPVPTYPPNANGLVLAQAGSPIFTLAGVQAWSRNGNGLDWSPKSSNLIVGDFNGDGKADIIVQSKNPNGQTYLLTASASGSVFGGTATALSGNVSLSGVQLIAAAFSGKSTDLYVQSATSGGTNYVVDGVSSTYTASVQNPSLGMGVVSATGVGRTAGQFAVGPGGAASYNIPIWVPPGARGIEPHLSLRYNSTGPDGLLGPGWAVSGISLIARCNRTWASDGAPGAITLTSADDICLDGNRLRATTGFTPACSGGSTYQTEVATFSNITACGASGSGPSYFVVQGKDGFTYQYGNGGNSQAIASGSTTPYAWGLSSVADRQGNNMVISYVSSATTLAPSKIQYTQTPSTGSSYPYTVGFNYAGRAGGSSISRYTAAKSVTLGNELISMSVSYAGTLVRQYNFTYTVSPSTLRPLLSNVQECGGSAGTDCLQPTSFKYQAGNTGWSSTAQTTGLSGQYGLNMIDVNGDGIPDAVYGKLNGSNVHWYARIASVGANGVGGGYGSEIDTGAQTGSGQIIIPGAFDGTGHTEFLAPSGSTWYVYKYNGSGFSGNSTGVTVNGEIVAVDYDGDGLADLVSLVSSTNVMVRRNTTAAGGAVQFAATATSVATVTAGAEWAGANWLPADFNGDGRADLLFLRIYPSGVGGVELVRMDAIMSNGFGAPATIGGFSTNTGANPSFGSVQIGDWNGDGCTDIITSKIVYVSDCTGNFSQIAINSAGVAMAVDWDGDGQTDLLTVNYSSNVWQVYRSTGTGFTGPVSTGIPYVSTRTYSTFDRNGDGQQEIYSVDSTNNYAVSYFPQLAADVPPDLLTLISDGFGITFSPTYVPITQSNYTKGSGAIFPVYDLQAPFYVVSQYSTSDGLGSTYQVSFSYATARFDQQGRGFLGFGSVQSLDSRNNVYHDITYRQDFPLAGFVAEDDYFQPGNATPTTKTTNTYSVVTLDSTANNLREFGYLSGVVSKKFESGGTKNGMQIATSSGSYTEDTYGNITNTSVTVTDTDSTAPASPFNGSQWVSTVANNIINDAGPNWCIGRPSTTTTTSTAPNEPTLTRTVDHTMDYTNCRATDEIVELNDSRLKLTTKYGFDGCGNTNSVSVIGLDQNGVALPARTTTSSFGTACEFAESVTNPLNQTASTQYNYSFGIPSQTTDVNNLILSWTFDDFGRKTQESRPDGTSTAWTYSDCLASSCWGTPNLRFLVTEQLFDSAKTLRRTTESFFDGLDRLTFQEGNRELGVWTNHATIYNSLGQKYREYLPYAVENNGFHQYGYDVTGRMLSDSLYDSTGSLNRSVASQYLGQTLSTTDAIGNVTSRVTDVNGKLRRVIDPASTANCPKGYSLCGTTSYDYDSLGNLVSITDAIGVHSSAVYNIRGFKTSTSDADSGTESIVYNSLGEILSKTDALNQTTSFGYDLLGRLTSRTEPESATPTQWVFGSTIAAHNVGKLQSVSKPDGYSETYAYDNVGRPSAVTYTEDGVSYVVSDAYNSFGSIDTVTYPSSTGTSPFTLKYGYDSYGFQNSLSDANTGSIFWTLVGSNDSSLPTAEVLGNGVQVSTSYTPWTNEMTARAEGSGSAPGSLQNLAYSWDVNGNLKQRQDMRQNLTEVFTPDALNRLTTTTLNGVQTLAVSYDAAGDILSKSDVGSYSYGDPSHPHGVTSAGSWTIGYDADGNVNSRAGGAINSYSYNLPNQINFQGNTDQFFYDSSHNRWKQVANYSGTNEVTHYVGGIFEVMSRGSVTEYRHHITAGSTTIVYARRSDGTSGTSYVTTDHLGSSDLVMDGSGNVLARESFTPFGARRGSNWQTVPSTNDYSVFASTTRRGFTGHEMLDAVSLIHMNGRVYDPYLGRFLSADTVIQSTVSSQSVNPYSYAWNAPLRFTDPSGHSLLGTIVGIVVAMVINYFLPGGGSAILAGFAGGFAGAWVSTGNFGSAFQAGVIGAITAGLFDAAGAGIQSNFEGSEWQMPASVLAHAAVGCAQAVMSSGNCGRGAAAAALSEAVVQEGWIQPAALGTWGSFAGTAEAGLVGGIGSRITGGGFDSGFSDAAAGYLFNSIGHILVGQNAHAVLLAYLVTQNPMGIQGEFSGNIALGGLFGGGRPDILYQWWSQVVDNDGRYYGWELKPYGQDAAAKAQLDDYIKASGGKLQVGNNDWIFQGRQSFTLESTWFAGRTDFTYFKGANGVITYKETNSNIFEWVTARYKERTSRGVKLVPFKAPTETATEATEWEWLFE